MALDRWPGHAERFGRVKDEGRAEAALLALTWLELNPRPRRSIHRLREVVEE